MPWLYLVVGLVFLFVTSLPQTPMWLAVLLVLAALGLFLAWMLGWMAQRLGTTSRNEAHLLGPDELRQLREQAEARKAARPVAEDDAEARDE